MAVTGYDSFSVHFSRDDSQVVVRLAGELDAATAPYLQEALAGVVDDQGNLSVRVDLGDVTFIDSTGLSVLVRTWERLRLKGGELALTNPRPSTLKVFHVVGLSSIFNITPPPVTDSVPRRGPSATDA